jgi:hypothetical protein
LINTAQENIRSSLLLMGLLQCSGSCSRNAAVAALMSRALVEGAEGEAKHDLSEGQLRLGLVECLNHSLLHPYPVLHEKQGDLVAQVRSLEEQFNAVAVEQLA